VELENEALDVCSELVSVKESQPQPCLPSEVHKDSSTRRESSEQTLSSEKTVSVGEEKMDSQDGKDPDASREKCDSVVREAVDEKMDSETVRTFFQYDVCL
jgi:hypothetical protein